MNGTALRKKKTNGTQRKTKKRTICWLIAMPVAGLFKRVRWKHSYVSDAATALKAFATRQNDPSSPSHLDRVFWHCFNCVCMNPSELSAKLPDVLKFP